MQKKRLLTGLQSTGKLHIGNYFGALKPFVDTYTDYDSFLMVADYHSLTSVRSGDEVRKNSLDVVKDYLAVGVDPSKATIFKQSDILEHTELAWIFNCLVTVPFLMQAHAYKDKVAKGLEANAGLFTYPMLMAADILLYDAELVPVGEDQRQHVEYAREAVTKFNNAYGETFTAPKELILKETGIVPGTDGHKMAKSRPQYMIPLFGTKDEIATAVMSIVTDSGGDIPENVFAIHKLYKDESELSSIYAANVGNYKASKEALIEDIDAYIASMREKRESITDEEVKKVLSEGSDKARDIASAKMTDVRQKVGVAL